MTGVVVKHIFLLSIKPGNLTRVQGRNKGTCKGRIIL